MRPDGGRRDRPRNRADAAGAVEALTDVLSLAAPAVFGCSARLKELVAGLCEASGHDSAWEIGVAALLAQVGAITLPADTAERLYAGAALSADEQAMIERIPAITPGILGKIPRLRGVLQILEHRTRRVDSVKRDGMLPVGARMLRIAMTSWCWRARTRPHSSRSRRCAAAAASTSRSC